MKVALLICDGGDGSACIRWFKDHLLAEKLCETEEEFYQNEGDPEIITVPDDWEPRGGFDDEHYLSNQE